MGRFHNESGMELESEVCTGLCASLYTYLCVHTCVCLCPSTPVSVFLRVRVPMRTHVHVACPRACVCTRFRVCAHTCVWGLSLLPVVQQCSI